MSLVCLELNVWRIWGKVDSMARSKDSVAHKMEMLPRITMNILPGTASLSEFCYLLWFLSSCVR